MRPTDPRLRRQLAPARSQLAGVLAAGVLSSALVIVQAWVVTGLVLAVLDGGRTVPWAAAVCVVFALRGLATWGSDALAAHAAARVGTSLRRRIVHAVLRRTAGHEPVPPSGEISVLATRGVASAEPYLTRYLPALALAGVLPLLTLLAIASQDLLSAVIVACTLPLIPVFGALVGLATRDRAEEQWRAMASLSNHFLDVVRGLPTLVVHRRARAQSRTIADITDRYREASLRTLRLAFASSAVLELVATISVALVAVVVGVRLASGSLELHTALVVLLLAPEAYWPLRRVGAEFHAAAEGVATFEAVDDLDAGEAAADPVADPVVDPVAGSGAPPAAEDALVVEDLTVRYPGRTAPALSGLDVRFAPRGVTVLTGPSGCGKTTLLSTVAGLVPMERGTVSQGGQRPGEESWQPRFAWLPQRPVFVTGTIADNLRLAAPLAEEARLWEVLRRVALEERLRDLPDGLDTELGEDAADLSAGERARLALARVVLADRPWVLLDEPTAHLDDLTEQIVLDTIAELGRTRGVLVVAHRPAILAIADAVVELPAPPPAATRAGTRPDRQGALPGVRTLRPSTDGSPAGHRTSMWPSTLLGALASASGVALTATAGWLIVQASSMPAVLTLLVAIVGVRTFGLARPVLRYAERLRSHEVALRMLAERRVEVYDALVPLTPGRLGKRRGDVLATVVDDVDSVVDRELRVRMPVRTFVMVVVTAGAVAWLLLPAAGVAISLSGLLSGTLAFGLARIGAGRAEREAVGRRAALSAEVVEVVQTSEALVMWQAGERGEDRVARASDRMGRALVRAARWTAAGRALALLVCGVGVAATALLAEPFVRSGDLSGPMMALLLLLPLALADIATPLADAGALAARTTAAAARLRTLEQAAPLVTETRAAPLPASHDLELTTVSGGWAPGSRILDRLSLSVPAGARVAVVGRSGSGKSTLAGMLLRFLDPSEGHVTLGGTPARWLGLDDLRSVVGLVDDDPHVFGTTLVENVRLARPGADDAEVERALRQARLGEWLDTLPRGLDTWLGDGHAEVSGGERARLGVARALLSRQRVLVLDEPIAHLDHATARQLADEVLTGPRERSVVWITHSPVGLHLVDECVDLDALPTPATSVPTTGTSGA